LHGAASAQQRNIAFEFAALQTWQVASKKNSDRKSSGLSWSSRHSPLIAPLCAMARRSELVSMHDRDHGARCHIARSRSNVKGSSSRYWFDSQKEKVRTYLNMLVFWSKAPCFLLALIVVECDMFYHCSHYSFRCRHPLRPIPSLSQDSVCRPRAAAFSRSRLTLQCLTCPGAQFFQ
jgi:hypothetical protein